MTTLHARLPKILGMALLVLLPVAIYAGLAEKASWRPRTLQAHQGSVTSVAFSPNGRTLAVASVNDTICLWNLSTYQIAKVLTLPGSTWLVTFTANGNTLVSQDWDDSLHILDTHSGALKGKYPQPSACGMAQGIQFSHDGKQAINSCGELYAIDATKGKYTKLQRMAAHDWVSNDTQTMDFSGDGQTVVSVSSVLKPSLLFWDLKSGRKQKTLNLSWPKGALMDALALASNSNLIATASSSATVSSNAAISSSGVICLWNLTTGALVRSIPSHQDYIVSLAFAPDESVLASGANDGTVKLWRIR